MTIKGTITMQHLWNRYKKTDDTLHEDTTDRHRR